MAGLRNPSRYCLLRKVQIRCYSAPVGRQIPESKLQYVPKSGTYPKGFSVSGTHVGVKPSNKTYPDLALITSEKPCSAAALFTKHAFEAAPVTISRQVLKESGSKMNSVIINSGNANSKTGTAGFEAARKMAAALDGVQPDATPNRSLVMSTGVIGVPLPIEKILNGVPNGISKLGSSHADWLDTAWSICTTDTFPKLLSTTFNLPSSPDITYSLAGMTKGAGMIHPNMATLLAVICTDADIAQDPLQAMLRNAAESSFNSISIDGCTSTNDTLAMLANGAAGGQPLKTRHTSDYKVMREVLTEFLQKLSHLVVRDGEGATKFVRVRVVNSVSHRDAKAVASKIACNPLVKTALYGKDANWGRILGAIDNTETSNVSEKASVSFVPTDGSETLRLVIDGEPQGFEEARATEILTQQDLEILVDLGGGRDGTGREEASYWFCDFSHEYVTINADYRT